MTPGTMSAPMSMIRRITSSGTMSWSGMNSSRNVPTSGNRTPASSTIQMTEPNVIPSRRYWRLAGTRPNRSVLAQPSAVVRIFPTKRDPNANSAARMAMTVSVRVAWLSRGSAGRRRGLTAASRLGSMAA